MKGYIVNKSHDKYGDVYSCVKRCLDGYFPDIVPGNDSKKNFLEKAACEKCNDNCHTCMLGGSDNCTSCLPGFYLNVLNSEAKTGSCLPKV